MRYRIVVGDWSDDGHGKSETFIFEIPDGVSARDMKAAYRRNVSFFGFDPQKDCEEYEDMDFPLEHLRLLVEGGFPYEGFDDTAEYQEVDTEVYAEILAFFLTNGLTTFTRVDDQVPVLLGGDGAVLGPEQYGYGFFS